MITLQAQEDKIKELANMHTSSQIDKYKNSIFLPYITLPNAKGKGTMMEEFFEWYLNELGIKTVLIKTNENYDFIINGTVKVELKVASIGSNDNVVFNQLHYGDNREVDKFLLTIIKPDDTIDFFIVPKEEFANGKISVQKQHSSSKDECARLSWQYDKMVKRLKNYQIDVDKLYENLI